MYFLLNDISFRFTYSDFFKFTAEPRQLAFPSAFFSVNKRLKNHKIMSNGNRTEWSPIWSVIIRVITKSDDRAAGVRFVFHEYDYRPNWTTRSPITN